MPIAGTNNETKFFASFLDLLRTGGSLRNIENVVASKYGTHVIGDDKDNVFVGRENREKFEGRGGDDSFISGDDDNEFYGEAGNDIAYADSGLLYYDGGADQDTVTYKNRAEGVTVSLQNRDTAQGDVLINVEVIEGSPHDDTITVSEGQYVINPGDGNNTVYLHGGYQCGHR